MYEEEKDENLEQLKNIALEYFHTEKYDDLNSILTKMIKLGSPWAMHYLAGSYTYGLGLEINLEKANELYLNSADLGFSTAQLVIGNNLIAGYGIEKDIARGIKYLNLASDQGNGYASFLLAEYYLEQAESNLIDHSGAIRYFRKSVDQGEHRAMQRLAWILTEGNITEKNTEEALSLNVKAAELGNEFAAYNAAGAFRYGNGTQKDCNKAIAYYEIAANLGMMEAMHNLGTMYYNAEGITKDIDKANEWYIKAAHLGSGLSSLCLGLMFEEGVNGSINNSIALYWFSIAGAQENTDAIYKMKVLSHKLSKEEIDKALSLLNSMSEGGFSWAQQALGSHYLSGKLIAYNKDLAIKWLSAAAEKGLTTAQVILEKFLEMKQKLNNVDGVLRESDYYDLPEKMQLFVDKLILLGFDRDRLYGFFILIGLYVASPSTKENFEELYTHLQILLPFDRTKNIDETIGHLYTGFDQELNEFCYRSGLNSDYFNFREIKVPNLDTSFYITYLKNEGVITTDVQSVDKLSDATNLYDAFLLSLGKRTSGTEANLLEAFHCGMFQIQLHASSDVKGAMQIAKAIRSLMPPLFSRCFHSIISGQVDYFLNLELDQIALLGLMEEIEEGYAKQMWGFQSSLFFKDGHALPGIDNLNPKEWHDWVLKHAEKFDSDYPSELQLFSSSNINLENLPSWSNTIKSFEQCENYLEKIWGYSSSRIENDFQLREYKALMILLVYSSLTRSRENIH
jgi:TPR repeat protein